MSLIIFVNNIVQKIYIDLFHIHTFRANSILSPRKIVIFFYRYFFKSFLRLNSFRIAHLPLNRKTERRVVATSVAIQFDDIIFLMHFKYIFNASCQGNACSAFVIQNNKNAHAKLI